MAVNAFFVNLFHTDVALAAGPGDVLFVNRRIAINAAFNPMDAVTVIAGRSNDEAHFQERPAMDAIRVLSRGIRIFHFVFAGQASVAVTLGASLRQVEFEDGRVHVFCGHDVMGIEGDIGVI